MGNVFQKVKPISNKSTTYTEENRHYFQNHIQLNS